MKAKFGFALIGIILVTVVPVFGCQLITAVTSITSPAALTREQAIAIVQVSGLPRIDEYYQEKIGETANEETEIGPVTTGAQWAAEYRQNEKTWVVQGTVITKNWGECLTTWTLNETTSELALIGFSCD